MNDVITKNTDDMSCNITAENPLGKVWIDKFIKVHSRKPRVLHVGNIANNAYNNAKLLNGSGIDCDVICYDYYHIMACPEWEDSDFHGDPGDHYCPRWHTINLKGFNRPRWFAQGPLKPCINYLTHKSRGNKLGARYYWLVLSLSRIFRCSVAYRILRPILRHLIYFPRTTFLLVYRVMKYTVKYSLILILAVAKYIISLLHIVVKRVPILLTLRHYVRKKYKGILGSLILIYKKYLNVNEVYDFDERVAVLVNEYSRIYSDRNDLITAAEFETYRDIIPYWRKLFDEYDVVQAYATDPIILMIAGNVPYVGFEHGTLRDFTICDKPICRLTTLGYKSANHVFITNGDCLEYAKAIKLKNYSAMLHPFDENKIRSTTGDYNGLHEKYGVKYIFLCTLRHEWEVKGTDIYIRAIPDLIDKIGDDFVLLMTRWGSQLDDSTELARALNVEKYIQWIEPLSRHELFRVQKSVDVLFDQIALPHFGATAPEGISSGVPVIMSYKPESTAWIVDEPAPILSAWNTIEVAESVVQAVDKEWLREYRQKAYKWIDNHHSSKLIIDKHLTAYEFILGF